MINLNCINFRHYNTDTYYNSHKILRVRLMGSSACFLSLSLGIVIIIIYVTPLCAMY